VTDKINKRVFNVKQAQLTATSWRKSPRSAWTCSAIQTKCTLITL